MYMWTLANPPDLYFLLYIHTAVFTLYPQLVLLMLATLLMMIACIRFTKIGSLLEKGFCYSMVLAITWAMLATMLVMLSYMVLVYCLKLDAWLHAVMQTYSPSPQSHNMIVLFQKLGVYTNPIGWLFMFFSCFMVSMLLLYFYGGGVDILSKDSKSIYYMMSLMWLWLMMFTHNMLYMLMYYNIMVYTSYFYYLFYSSNSWYEGQPYTVMGFSFDYKDMLAFGSCLSLACITYMFQVCGTLNFKLLMIMPFTQAESLVLFVLLVMSIVIQAPLLPFNPWLDKVHEANAEYSMFLSNFLAKTAMCCIYQFSLIFLNPLVTTFLALWIMLITMLTMYKMWLESDLKKMMMLASMQELSMLLYSMIVLPMPGNSVHMFCSMVHSMLFVVMYAFADNIKEMTGTQNIQELSGLGQYSLQMKIFIWPMLMFYLGSPFTIKYAFLVLMGNTMLYHGGGPYVVLIFVITLFLGMYRFYYCWKTMMYGTPSPSVLKLPEMDMPESDWDFLCFLSAMLFMLTAFMVSL